MNLTKLYFDQGLQYFSESGEKLIPIAEMPRPHAANAARKLLAESDFWYGEAGLELKRNSRVALWMLNTALFKALTARATGETPAPREPVTETIIDGHGDRWTLQPDGLYAWNDGDELVRSAEYIEAGWGIKERY